MLVCLFVCVEVFRNGRMSVPVSKCWSPHIVSLSLNYILWQVDGTASERRQKSAERRSEEMLTGWVLVLDWIYYRMSILFIGSCLTGRDWSSWDQLTSRVRSAEIKPERVDWESVRSALAEQLRYNLRSPHTNLNNMDGLLWSSD